MMREIRIYFEGDRKLRLGLGNFLSSVRERAKLRNIHWNLVASGPRSRAYRDFVDALSQHPNAFNILLVDAEEPVVHSPWEHLHRRKEDGWARPGAGDDQCHLMVQMMETWFLADVPALKDYYGNEFNENAIPKAGDIEGIEKKKIESALDEATRKTNKGKYHKTHHAPDLLSKVNVEKVRKAAPACERLYKVLNNWIDSEASNSDG